MRSIRGAPERHAVSWIRSRQASVVLLAVALLVVLVLSLYPRPRELLGPLSLYDTAGHFAAYLVLGFLTLRAVGRPGVGSFVIAIASCATFGGLIEVVQPLTGRRRDLGDFLVDLAGTAIGAAVAWCLARTTRTRG